MSNNPQHPGSNPTPALSVSSRQQSSTEPLEVAPDAGKTGDSPTVPTRIEGFVPIAMIVMDRWPMGPVAYNYAKAMEAGEQFPPIKLAKRCDGRFQIRDGRHRLLAAKLLGYRAIWARYSSKPMQQRFFACDLLEIAFR